MIKYILTGYIESALSQAEYSKLEDETFSGRIPPCKGVIAFGKTLRECKRELQSTLEDWILVGLKLDHPLPAIDDYDLNREPAVDSIFCPKCSSADVFKDTGAISKDLEELISECEDDIDDEDFDESEYEENMQSIANLQSRQGTTTLIGHHFAASFEELAKRGEVDCFIVSTEDGFSPLGANRDFFADDLGIDDDEIRKIANWNRFKNDEVSLIGLPSRNPSGRLRGVVLAASETSICYQQFAPAFHSMPYRNFYYNVAYESISYAAKSLGARKIAISHLSGSGHFHEDIATCIAEALAHFCDNAKNPKIDSFLFVGCCIEERDLSGIRRLNMEGEITRHRDICTTNSKKNGFEVISLDWR